MNTSFSVEDHYPNIYKIILNEEIDLEGTFSDIMDGIPVSRVHETMANYVTSVIEPTDWSGIWRTSLDVNGSPIRCDFMVEIIDVTHKTTEAVVILRKLLSPSVSQLTTQEFDAIDEFMTQEKVKTVKLTEIWVISEGDEEDQRLVQTAVVIEQTRWFYRYIWRPWDDLSDSSGQEVFIDTRFQPRLKLYHDMKSSKQLKKKVEHLLKEATSLKGTFDTIQASIAAKGDKGSIHSCDDNMEEGSNDTIPTDEMIDETDIMQAVSLDVRIREIERKMEMLEDPYKRMIVLEEDELSQDSLDDLDVTRIHVVSKIITQTQLEMVSNKLTKNKWRENPLFFHTSFGKAVKSCRSSDKVFVLPGHYPCKSLPTKAMKVEIIGISNDPSTVVLVPCDSLADSLIQSALMNGITIQRRDSMNK